ncbi:MAG: hypothetical protein IBJ10_01395 [Phycisphaerales bacterium]|nr:hypothetical protein [Phycisphaerales bacterium]
MTGLATVSDRIHWPTAVGRGAFLACSWTWCIGMWLPVILIREFGWMGFIAFAIPNVVGAAGMGLALRRPGASERLSVRYGRAMRAFSLATIAFHAFFVTWMMGPLASWVSGLLVAAPALILAVGAFGLRPLGSRAWTALAPLCWLGSATLLGTWLFLGRGGIVLPEMWGRSHPTGLLWLTPVLALGFGACPFLDPTFHRVRRETPGATGSAAFVLGFGALFLVMIVATALYAGGAIERRSLSSFVLGHMLLQSIFTVGAHAREVDRRTLWTPILIGLAAALVPKSAWFASPGLSSEDVYRLFMGFYGLLFPAYVWIVMTPRRSASGLATWLGALALAAPCFWLGFIEMRWVWLAPGCAIVLGAPLVRGLFGPAKRGHMGADPASW